MLWGAALSGCVSATVEQIRQKETGIIAGDAVVIIGRTNRPSADETEMDFIGCVAKGLANNSRGLSVIDKGIFQDQTFPWFEPRLAPRNAAELMPLLKQPLIAQRLEELDLRYLIWIDGQTRRTSQSGSLGCSVTPGGGGCFGFLTWDDDAAYEAVIWDTEDGRTAGKVSSDASGTSYMPAVVVPIPILARVQKNACSGLVDQLRGFLLNTDQRA